MKLEETTYQLSGIYKITFDNQKIYIGRTNSLRRRMIEHIGKDVREHPELSISKAIIKHKIIDISLLEELPAEDIDLQRQREIYWIAQYNSYLDKTIGYNETPGGDGTAEGIYNISASITSQEQLDKIIDLLLNSSLTYEEICQECGLTNRMILTRINSGQHYFNPNLSYPLRKKRIDRNELNNKQSKFFNNKDLLLDIIETLKNINLSYDEICSIYGISMTLLTNINTGKRYKVDGINYPIRKKNASRQKIFSNDQLNEIRELLINTKISMTDIGKQFNISRDIVSDINNGKRQKQDNWNYPIRKTSK